MMTRQPSTNNLSEAILSQRGRILEAAARHGVSNVRVFGSEARGEASPDSDLDLLVDLQPGRTLFDLGALLMDMQDMLGRRVDIVTEKGLHWYIRDRVISEAVAL